MRNRLACGYRISQIVHAGVSCQRLNRQTSRCKYIKIHRKNEVQMFQQPGNPNKRRSKHNAHLRLVEGNKLQNLAGQQPTTKCVVKRHST